MMNNKQQTCRWGILGAAKISQKVWRAIHYADNAIVSAVASRRPGQAQQFIAQQQAKFPFPTSAQAFDNYDQLLNQQDIDAVYIPLPTQPRQQWVIKAAQAGKHVLCEKPCAVSAADLAEMIAACQQHQVQFMDNTMFMHHQRLNAVANVLNDTDNFGAIKHIATQFGFRASEQFLSEDIRLDSRLEPMGCLGDLGWYTIRFILWTMNFQLPDKVSGRILAQQHNSNSPQAVPIDFSGELLFPDNVSASFYCSFLVERQQWANISGTKRYLSMNDFVLPENGCDAFFQVEHNHFDQHGKAVSAQTVYDNTVNLQGENEKMNHQTTKLIENFSTIALSNQLEDYWPEISLKTQQVLDSCFASAKLDGKLISLK